MHLNVSSSATDGTDGLHNLHKRTAGEKPEFGWRCFLKVDDQLYHLVFSETIVLALYLLIIYISWSDMPLQASSIINFHYKSQRTTMSRSSCTVLSVW